MEMLVKVQYSVVNSHLQSGSHLVTAHQTVSKAGVYMCMHQEAQDRESVYIDIYGVINPWSIL